MEPQYSRTSLFALFSTVTTLIHAAPAIANGFLKQQVPVMRYDRDHLDFHNGARSLVQTPTTGETGHTMNSLKSLTQSENPFQIDFTCEAGVDEDLCQKAEKGFIASGQRIAQVFAFPQTIKVKATFKSFCKGQTDGCDLADTLGQAAPAAYFSARPEDVKDFWFFYPQALVKQLNHDIKLIYNEYDILAEFNADFNFYFASGNEAIKPNQTDFEFVATHEFTHGLGFDTSWSQWGTLFSAVSTSSSYLAPLPFIKGSTVNTATVPNWQPLTIFDRFTVESGSSAPMLDRAKSIYSYDNPNVDFKSFVSGFESSGDPYTSAQEMFKLVTSGSGAMKVVTSGTSTSKANEVLNLQTSRSYQAGSSIAHCSLDQLDGPEFLMVPAVQNLTGSTVDQIIERSTNNGQTSPKVIYGPKMIALMTAMGYATHDQAQVATIEINPNSNGSPVSSATSLFEGGRLALGLSLLVMGYLL